MNIEKLFRKSTQEDFSIEDFELFSDHEGIELPESFNTLSMSVARKFDNNEISYEDGDHAMNKIWTIMLNYIMEKNINLIQPCYSIYCAFDHGEYDHRDGSDPVEQYTRPAIREILQNA